MLLLLLLLWLLQLLRLLYCCRKWLVSLYHCRRKVPKVLQVLHHWRPVSPRHHHGNRYQTDPGARLHAGQNKVVRGTHVHETHSHMYTHTCT